MFKNKTIQVFDAEILRPNSFITYAKMGAGDDGEREALYKINGIIKSVSETHITLLTANRDVVRISIDTILEGKIHILGIMDNAIGKATKLEVVNMIKNEVKNARNGGNQTDDSYADGIVYASELLGLEIE